MIKVTRFNGGIYYINPHLIESIESHPDTTITVMPSKKLVVKESIEEVISRIINYRRSIGISCSDAEANDYILEGGTSK